MNEPKFNLRHAVSLFSTKGNGDKTLDDPIFSDALAFVVGSSTELTQYSERIENLASHLSGREKTEVLDLGNLLSLINFYFHNLTSITSWDQGMGATMLQAPSRLFDGETTIRHWGISSVGAPEVRSVIALIPTDSFPRYDEFVSRIPNREISKAYIDTVIRAAVQFTRTRLAEGMVGDQLRVFDPHDLVNLMSVIHHPEISVLNFGLITNLAEELQTTAVFRFIVLYRGLLWSIDTYAPIDGSEATARIPFHSVNVGDIPDSDSELYISNKTKDELFWTIFRPPARTSWFFDIEAKQYLGSRNYKESYFLIPRKNTNDPSARTEKTRSIFIPEPTPAASTPREFDPVEMAAKLGQLEALFESAEAPPTIPLLTRSTRNLREERLAAIDRQHRLFTPKVFKEAMTALQGVFQCLPAAEDISAREDVTCSVRDVIMGYRNTLILSTVIQADVDSTLLVWMVKIELDQKFEPDAVSIDYPNRRYQVEPDSHNWIDFTLAVEALKKLALVSNSRAVVNPITNTEGHMAYIQVQFTVQDKPAIATLTYLTADE